MAASVPVFASPSPAVRAVDTDRPWAWLAAGWKDLMTAPQVSLTYGAVFAAFGLALGLSLWIAGLVYLLLPMAAGFMLLGPILATGLYATSRDIASGRATAMQGALAAWEENRTQIALMGLILALVFLLWIRIATLLFALFFGKSVVSLANLVEQTVFSASGPAFLITGTAIGAVLATGVFSIAVISVPMLLDRQVSVFTAIATSVEVVRRNPRTMALWAALIALFTGVGLVTFFVGVAVALPLVAHATWHAYRDLVDSAGGT